MVFNQILFAILLSIVLGQSDLGRPDVTISEHNDRFDVGDIMEEQNQDDKGDDFRTNIGDQAKLFEVVGTLQKLATNNIAKTLENTSADKSNNQEIEYAFSHATESEDTEDNFEKSFKIFKTNTKKIEEEYKRKANDNRTSEENIMKYLHGEKGPSRRTNKNINTDAEILLHYAVPVVLQIQGYVLTPLDG